MAKPKMYRQGDVLLIEVSQVPSGAKTANPIVAYGEYSGHHHITKNCDVLELENEKFVVAKKNAAIAHEKNGKLAEHLPIELPQGIYKVIMQRQYNPILGWQKAID